MFNFMSDVRCSNVVVKSLGVIFYDNFTLTFTLILPFDEFFLNIIVSKGLNKGAEFFLLVVPCGSAWVNEDGGTDDSCQYFRFLKLSLVDIEYYK